MAERVAMADNKTLSGVYMEQINETIYDYAKVKMLRTAIFTGKFLLILEKSKIKA